MSSVTLGYLLAAAVAVALWFGLGILLIPLMLILALIHRITATRCPPVAHSHQRWLARHHALSALVLVGVLILPLTALPRLFETVQTILNTLAYAPHPVATLQAAWPQLGVGELALAGFVLAAGWLLATLWISIRLIRRWLRWADGRAA